jgi:hypothetical protein
MSAAAGALHAGPVRALGLVARATVDRGTALTNMRNYFTMPAGTKVGTTVSIDPVRVPLDPPPVLFLSGTKTINIVLGSVVVSYVATTFQGALDMLFDIHSIGAQAANPDVAIIDHSDMPVALSFVSLTPSTGTSTGTIPAITMAGTGFLLSGIASVKADDGAGHTAVSGVTIISDVQMSLDFDEFGKPAGSYTIYYTTDNVNWITTALAFTVIA